MLDSADLQIFEIINELVESEHDMWHTEEVITFLEGYLSKEALITLRGKEND